MARKRIGERTISQINDEMLRSANEYERKRKIELANYSQALQNKSTRMLVREIIGFTGFYDVNATCDNSVFMTEGKRRVGQMIIELLAEIDENLYLTILQEGINQRGDE